MSDDGRRPDHGVLFQEVLPQEREPHLIQPVARVFPVVGSANVVFRAVEEDARAFAGALGGRGARDVRKGVLGVRVPAVQLQGDGGDVPGEGPQALARVAPRHLPGLFPRRRGVPQDQGVKQRAQVLPCLWVDAGKVVGIGHGVDLTPALIALLPRPFDLLEPLLHRCGLRRHRRHQPDMELRVVDPVFSQRQACPGIVPMKPYDGLFRFERRDLLL